MTASTEPRGGLDLGWDPGEDGWGPAMNANLLRLSRLGFHCSVLSATTTTPPGSPISGAGYIIPAGATGEWVGRTGRIAIWDGSAWAYAVPRDGWAVHVVGSGVMVYEDGLWSQENLATPAGVGAEPFAGIPAQTSFWRSTAAGVRAWVQLVAADITDLATTLATYLTKLNPTYTGTLTGSTAVFTNLTATGNPVFGTSAAGASVTINSAAETVASINLQDAGVVRATMQLYTGSAWRVVARDTSGVEIDSPFYVDLVAGGKLTLGGTARTTNFKGAIEIGATTVIDASRNITGATVRGLNAAGTGIRPAVALADGTFDDQDAATFRGTIGALAASLKGAVNGVAELGADGRVPSGQLPSYVDDVLEYATFSAFPATGETGKIYVNLDQNKTWRWSGSAYVEISASLALGETSATAYRGDRGKTAYDHSQVVTGNPHAVTAAEVGALPAITLTGAIDSRSINGGAPGLYRLNGSSYIEFPASLSPTSGGTLLQTLQSNGYVLQELFGPATGRQFQVQTGASTWSGWTRSWDNDILPVSTTGYNVVTAASQAAARTAISAAKAPSRLDVSASANLGDLDASAIKVTATDVNLTLSGGTDGQWWDIIGPDYSTGIVVPSGATLWKSSGYNVGPATTPLGGGKPVRITRIDETTWIMLGSQ